jgi:hypothetical protein
MSLFDTNDDNTQAQGGLSILNRLRGQVDNGGNQQRGGGWGDIWAARGGFNFSLKKGEEAKIVFLEDIRIFVATPIVVGWVNANGYSFAKTEYLRSSAYDDLGEPTGEIDLVSQVTGMRPTLIGVAPILDLRPFTTKDGKEFKYSVRPLLIKTDSVLNQLQTIAKHSNRTLQNALMSVSRSATDSKAPGAGDTWFLKQYMEDAELSQQIPDLAEIRGKCNVDVGYPRPDAALSKELLGLHANVVNKNQDKKDAICIQRFDAAAWAEVSGAPAPMSTPVSQDVASAAADQFEGLEDLTPVAPAAPAAPAASTEGGFDLGDLDDVLG